jgi:hypothetical protein
VTPALSAVYDELLSRASVPPLEARAHALRDAFLRRTSTLPPIESVPEDRVLAAWDDALTTGGLAAELAPGFKDGAERALVRVLPRAHRGVFRLDRVGPHSVVLDLLSGAEFILLPRDDLSRGLASGSDPNAPLFEARIVAAPDGCASLPGVIFHPPDATPLIEQLLTTGRARGMTRGPLCDALLRMQNAFFSLSRVKIGYAYRVEALEPANEEAPTRSP